LEEFEKIGSINLPGAIKLPERQINGSSYNDDDDVI
jgi:hypothetical protein